MIHSSQNCPMYLAENGQWASSMSPYCDCTKFKEVATTPQAPTMPDALQKYLNALTVRNAHDTTTTGILSSWDGFVKFCLTGQIF